MLDRIIVEPVQNKIEQKVVLYYQTRQDKSHQEGKVVEVGKDCETIEKGDLVLYPKYSGIEVQLMKEEH